MTQTRETTYRDAGVDIDAGNRLVERIRPLVDSTLRPGALGGIGGFGGLFRVPTEGLTEPVLVAGTDGVGTKLKLALQLGRHDTVGIDLVAMCANDIVVLGAEPLFFLDYYGCGRLDEDIAAAVVAGIAEGCRQAGAALIGGETAEMPGMYADDDYDLAGFCVGIVDRAAIIDGHAVTPGDAVIGLGSSGPHSNGFSLIRRILADTGADLGLTLGQSTLGESLLAPTRIYVRAVQQLIAAAEVRALAHVTGGGIAENLARVLPESVDARIDSSAWNRPAVFDWLAESGNVSAAEMHRTFNCGIGMLAIVPAADSAAALDALHGAGETAMQVGEIVSGAGRVRVE